MSKPIDDGGPAFPVVFDSTPPPVTAWATSGPIFPMTTGMSLRDWFAGQVLAGIRTSTTGQYTPKNAAVAAYAQADAMIAARKAKP